MKIILLKDVKKIGKEGGVVRIKDGYARNYLIPGGFALLATKDNIVRQKQIKKKHLQFQNTMLDADQKLKAHLESVSLTLIAEVKENDEIYGSINEARIMKALQSEGINLERKEIQMDNPIKKLGVYNLIIKLLSGIEANLKIWVVKK